MTANGKRETENAIVLLGHRSKLYNGQIRLLADHDFTVRCMQVESIARSRLIVPLSRDSTGLWNAICFKEFTCFC